MPVWRSIPGMKSGRRGRRSGWRDMLSVVRISKWQTSRRWCYTRLWPVVPWEGFPLTIPMHDWLVLRPASP